MGDDELADFERTTFAHDGKERAIFRRGTGPAVIVIAEMPGITPKVAEFARRVATIGCTAVMPHLFGTPGKDPITDGRLRGTAYMLSSFVPACVSREFTTWATNRTSPVVAWLRALAGTSTNDVGVPVSERSGCASPAAMPWPWRPIPALPPRSCRNRRCRWRSPAKRRSIDCSPNDLEVVKARCAGENLTVLGLRFSGDKFVPGERFVFLRAARRGVPCGRTHDEAANPEGVMKPHSVLTEHLIDEPDQPTRAVLDEVLDLFRTRSPS